MKLSEIHEEWKKDGAFDDTALDMESERTHVLHGKYLRYMSECRLEYKAALKQKAKIMNTLEEYFRGALDGKEIGRPPFKLTVTAAKIERLIQADDEFQKVDNLVILAEEKLLCLTEIIKSINQRTYSIGNSIKYKKFVSGEMTS